MTTSLLTIGDFPAVAVSRQLSNGQRLQLIAQMRANYRLTLRDADAPEHAAVYASGSSSAAGHGARRVALKPSMAASAEPSSVMHGCVARILPHVALTCVLPSVIAYRFLVGSERRPVAEAKQLFRDSERQAARGTARAAVGLAWGVNSYMATASGYGSSTPARASHVTVTAYLANRREWNASTQQGSTMLPAPPLVRFDLHLGGSAMPTVGASLG